VARRSPHQIRSNKVVGIGYLEGQHEQQGVAGQKGTVRPGKLAARSRPLQSDPAGSSGALPTAGWNRAVQTTAGKLEGLKARMELSRQSWPANQGASNPFNRHGGKPSVISQLARHRPRRKRRRAMGLETGRAGGQNQGGPGGEQGSRVNMVMSLREVGRLTGLTGGSHEAIKHHRRTKTVSA